MGAFSLIVVINLLNRCYLCILLRMTRWRNNLLIFKSHLNIAIEKNWKYLFPASVVLLGGWGVWAWQKDKVVRRKEELSRKNFGRAFDISGTRPKEKPKSDHQIKLKPMSEEDKKIAMSGVIQKKVLPPGTKSDNVKGSESIKNDPSESDSTADMKDTNIVLDYIKGLFNR